MADSRSGLEAPAELSNSGRFLPSHSTATEFEFACRVCGGSELRVDTRPGVEVVLSTLQPWQGVGFNDLRGHHSLYTCIRCEEAVRTAQNRVRETLLAKLLFAAKNLAERQFTRSKRNGACELICVECRTPQVAESYLRHRGPCSTGLVMTLLQTLMSLDDPRNFHLLLEGAAGFLNVPERVGAGIELGDLDMALRARQNGGAR